MTAVHDLPKEIFEVHPGDLAAAGVLHVVGEDDGAVSQVADGEGVHHVVAHGTIQLALHHHGVEMAESEQNRFCFRI